MKMIYSIKTKTSALLVLFFMAFSVSAQIDRSKQPQAGPAPKISLEKPQEFTLKNGLKVLVVENHKLPRVSFRLTLDNPPVLNGDKSGVSSLLAAMLGNGTTRISKDDFNNEVDFLGANISFGATNAFASSLSKYSNRILELMADAALNPLLVEEEFKKEKDKLLEGLKSEAKNVNAVAGRVGNALSYGIHHPYGEFTTEATLNNVTFADVLAYYKKYFKPNNSYMVVVGDVEFKSVKKAIEKRFGKWTKTVDVATSLPNPAPNAEFTQINFVDMPNAVQSNINLTHNVELKMKDPDYHALLIANKILGGGFNSYLNMNLREARGYTYGASSNIDADKYVSSFSASTAVRNMVTDSTVVETLKEINRIKNEPVNPDDLKNAKAKYVGDFVLALERPQTVARYALNIKTNDLPADFYETYLQKINAVTTEDVMRVANKYFKPENARIIVVGKGSDVIENLEKTGIPVKYFDTYANPVDKPEFTKPIPTGISAQTVLNGYINAIGGKTNAEKVNSLSMKGKVTIEGAPFTPTAEIKTMAPNKESMEMSIEGMGTIVKQKFNGTKGYIEQQGMKKEMTETEIASKKDEYSIFPELYYDVSKVNLESIVSIDGKDVYKLKIDTGKNPSYRYYNTKTSLLERVETTVEAQGNSITSIQDYSNYTSINNLNLPFTQSIKAGPQTITINLTAVKINEGVTETDFN